MNTSSEAFAKARVLWSLPGIQPYKEPPSKDWAEGTWVFRRCVICGEGGVVNADAPIMAYFWCRCGKYWELAKQILNWR